MGSRITAAQLFVDLLRPDGGTPPVPSKREWDLLSALAVREQMSALVLAAANQRYGDSVPEEIRGALVDDDNRARAHAAAAFEQLAAVLRRFCRAGVAVALIKGAALSRFAYPGGGRGFLDLDLFVRASDRGAAARVLQEAGYVTVRDRARAVENAGEQVYWDPSWRRVPIDVHWRLDSAPVCLGLDHDGMLRRARSENVDTEPVLLLTPADTLVALSAHFVKHVWGCRPRLRYLRDVAEVTRRWSVDWGQVAQAAVDAPRARSPLRVTLGTAAELMGAPVAPAALGRLAPRGGALVDRYLRASIRRRVLEGDAGAAALLQVALMRWLDGDTASIFPRLLADFFDSRTRRLAANVLGVRGRRAVRRLLLRGRGSSVDRARARAGTA